MSDSPHIGKLRLAEWAQAGVNLFLDKENHSIFIPDGGDPTNPKNWNLDISVQNNSSSLI